MTISVTSPERPACNHTPRDPIAAFYHVCRDCGAPIEPVPCEACEGIGLSHPERSELSGSCRKCDGTGTARWEAAP